MFNNIGRKIKFLAIVLTVINMISFIILGFIFIFSGVAYAPLYGLIIIIVGCVVLWLTSFVLYGYGELIDKTPETAKNSEQLLTVALQTVKKTEQLLIIAVAETIEKSEKQNEIINELKKQVFNKYL